MKKFWSSILLFTGVVFFGSIQAQTNTPETGDSRALIVSQLNWKTGTITVPGGKATLNLPPDYRFLEAADARHVLEEVWGNPPDPGVLGMVFPADRGPLDKGTYGVIISYENNGHVKDDDESKINYDDLLKQMQTEIRESNAQRKEQGYPSIELLGWAEPPHYDKDAHKLYWAKKIQFEGESNPTLNYDIRILGRTGVLVLSFIGGMDQLDEIRGKTPEILTSVDFNQGSRYVDFDPTTDKIAEYGIATLIAGGALAGAAKLGFFGLLFKYSLIAILALKKAIIFVVIAVGAAVKKGWDWLSGRKKVQFPSDQNPPQ